MKSWIDIIIHPLGLAGFALSIVFGLLAKRSSGSAYPWLAPVAVAMAFITLLGGLGLAFQQAPRSSAPSSESTLKPETQPPEAPSSSMARTPAPVSPSTKQHTTGAQSPAVSGVGGNVDIENRELTPQEPSRNRTQTEQAKNSSNRKSVKSPIPAQSNVEQHTEGAQSPAVSQVGGDVTIRNDGKAKGK